MGCHFFLWEIFLTQGSNAYLLHLLHWQVDSLPLSHLGSPFPQSIDAFLAPKKKKPSSHQDSLIAQLVKNLPGVQEILVRFPGREDPWKRDRLPTPVFLGFPCGSAGKESTYNSGDLGSIPGLRKSPGEGKGYPLQYSGLENSMDSIVHGVEKSWTRLSDFHFHQDCWTACFLLGV